MKTTGQILQEARLAKKLELSESSRITRIRPQFLALLEADDYRQLPSATVAKGFIRNYGQFLGLNPSYLLAVFRRDFIENPQGQIVPRGMVEPVTKTSVWTPKSTVIALIVMLFVVFGGYLTYQFIQLLGPPYLILNQPQSETIVSDATIEITGRTDPEATISVNDQLVVLDKGGTFSVRLPLVPGPNEIRVTSTSKSGKTTTLTRSVTLTPSP